MPKSIFVAVVLHTSQKIINSKCYAPLPVSIKDLNAIYQSNDYACAFHLTEEAPGGVVEEARLPSILRLASCLSA